MDKDAQRVLEFGKITHILAGYAVTPRGKARATELRPMDDADAIRHALRETSEMAAALGEGYSLPLAPVEDVSQHAEKAQAGGGPLEPAALWRIAECVDTANRVAGSLQRLGGRYPALMNLGYSLPQCPELVERIRSAIDPSGLVLDDASAELKQIRRKIRALRRRIEEVLRRMIEHPDIRPHLQYANPTIYRERYVLPVNAYRKHEVEGLVHGSSDSGATLYIEPMRIIDSGNELSQAIGEEADEVERILWVLTRTVGAECETITSAVERLAEVDLVRAKALMSSAFDMCAPDTASPGELDLHEARHPLLLWLTRSVDTPTPQRQDMDARAVVPLDLHLGQDFDMLVITGPNTGGKTVALKTVGLLCLMARAGMHVPAKHARVPVYDAVYADIGDEQSIEQSLSTFSSHMSRIVRILDSATRKSLVLLDELGAGTDPAEGSALGEAILSRLEAVGCAAVVVTHLGQLKTFAVSHARVENASVEFDTQTLQPTYRLEVGTVGSSNALLIARRLGLPEDILDEARGLLDSESEGEYSSLLEQVRVARQDAEQRRERMQYLEDQARQLKGEYEQTLKRLKAEEERRGADIGLKMQKRLQELCEEADALHEDVRFSHKAVARRVRAIRNGLRECLGKLSKLLSGHALRRPLEAGDDVYVIKMHKWGTVERLNRDGDRARVRVGNTQVDVSIDDLQPWADNV